MDNHAAQMETPERLRRKSHRWLIISLVAVIVIAVVLTVVILIFGSSTRSLYVPASNMSPLHDPDENGALQNF